jgi:hypothetical protein
MGSVCRLSLRLIHENQMQTNLSNLTWLKQDRKMAATNGSVVSQYYTVDLSRK